MRNAVMVANQASEKAMKAKRHVVLARRRLAIALLSAEREVVTAKQAKSNGEPVSTSCSHGSSRDEAAIQCRDGRTAQRGDVSSEQKNSEDSEAGTNNSSDKLDNASSSSAFLCPCGTQLKDGMPVCSCKSCGVSAHRDCLVMQATTEGRTFSQPYVCKSCKSKDTDAATTPPTSEAGEESAEEFQLMGGESKKRKAADGEARQESNKRERAEFRNILGGLLGDFHTVLQGGLLPQQPGVGMSLDEADKQSNMKGSATPDSISSAISFSLVKAPQSCIPLVKEGHEVISENTLLDNVLQDMTDLDGTVGLHW
jgi:hypothetical protein